MLAKTLRIITLFAGFLVASCSRSAIPSPELDLERARAVFVATYQTDTRTWRVQEIFKNSGVESSQLRVGAEIQMTGSDADDLKEKPRRLIVVTTPIEKQWSDEFIPRWEAVIKDDRIKIYNMTLAEYRTKIEAYQSAKGRDHTVSK